MTQQGAISEFFFSDESLSPYQVIARSMPQSYSTKSSVSLYRVDPFTYCVIDEDTGAGVDVSGRATTELDSGITNSLRNEKSNNTDGWSHLFIDAATIYRDYDVTESGSKAGARDANAEFIIERNTGRFACLVSSGYCIASTYGCTAGWDNMKNDYIELWDLTSTSQRQPSNGTPGIMYGQTSTLNGANGIKQYCAKRGKYLSYELPPIPSYEGYRDCINRGDMGVLCGDAKGSGGGHAVAVAGYMTLVDKGNPFAFIRGLSIYNTWQSGFVVYNFNLVNFNSWSGIYFHS